MAEKSFSIQTEPHLAKIGDVTLSFVPEANGSELIQNYSKLRKIQQSVNLEENPEDALKVIRAAREFLGSLMLPESQELFTTLDVVADDGKILASFRSMERAEAEAARYVEAKIVDRFPLPQRVMTKLTEWALEVLGGGARPTGSSSDS